MVVRVRKLTSLHAEEQKRNSTTKIAIQAILTFKFLAITNM
jgi:hypothetical protein